MCKIYILCWTEYLNFIVKVFSNYKCLFIDVLMNCIHFRHAWDLALDLCLSQLNGILEEGKTFQHSPFFAEQLTAFQVWLSYGCQKRSPPEQLPIVLQVQYNRFPFFNN